MAQSCTPDKATKSADSADYNNLNQTGSFRIFIRQFFKEEQYQIDHVKFPLATESQDEDGFHTSTIDRSEWEYMRGPEFYQCELDCYDLVLYDNFDKLHKETGKRVLSFEGVENGIQSALYFELINGEWFLVRQDEFDT